MSTIFCCNFQIFFRDLSISGDFSIAKRITPLPASRNERYYAREVVEVNSVEKQDCSFQRSAPKVRPLSRCFWAKPTKARAGMMSVTAAAVIFPYCTS